VTVAVYSRYGGIAEAVQVLGQQHAAASRSDATDTEGALYTLSLPPLGPNDSLQILTKWTVPSSATAKNLRIRLGGISGTQFAALSLTTSASEHHICYIHNRGATNSQIGQVASLLGAYANSSSALVTGTVDTSVSQDLVVSAQWGTAGAGSNNITLESVLVLLIPGV